MKKLIILIINFISLFSYAEKVISLEEVTEKVKQQNLVVLQNAEKVYQAKLSIDEARLNLLPRLNLWNVGRVLVDPTALLDVVQDIAPFLVPSNWFRLKETEILYKAEKEGYRALQANELYAARSLYLKVLMDQELYNSLRNHALELGKIRRIAEDRADIGLDSPDVSREIQIQHLKIQEDVTQLNLLVDFEKRTLAQALGFPVNEQLILKQVNLANADELSLINPVEWEQIAIKNSPEVSQYAYFLKVLPQIKKEIKFSFLGVPTLSRGTAGGAFDNLPVSQGLGFATGKQISIVNSQKKILELQRKGIEETIKRQILNVSQTHNAAAGLYPSLRLRISLTEQNFESLKQRLQLGVSIKIGEVSTLLLSLSQSRASYAESTYRFVMNYDMLNRLSLTGPYADFKAGAK